MKNLIRFCFVALLCFTATNDAMADCGDCPGDKVEGHAHEGGHAEGAHAEGAHAEGAQPEGAACESCAKGKAGETVWCESCSAGFHDSKKIKCQGCFDKLSGKTDKDCASCAAHKKPANEG
jgi:hypothetical protein